MSIKELLLSKKTEHIIEVHNALSAKIAENAGFRGVWCSSFTLSATKGLRDTNEMTMTDVINTVDEITNSSEIPVLLDADNGYGDYNNSMLLVKRAEKVNASGICVEDKKFPKVNSLIDNRSKQLLEIDDFCRKIQAMCCKREKEDFSIIARTEGFIYGESPLKVHERATAYAEAGADAIFIHSRKSNINEDIEKFMKLWSYNIPIVICPTTYSNTNPKLYEDLGISMVIWSNQMLRAAVNSMKHIAENIFNNKSLEPSDEQLVSVQEIFKLQNMEEYNENLRKFG